ncbi:MAG TPA: ABC transporter substrate-binding protein [Gaiellaceae bacterium]|nr:ABC transporter substrate-binding protein [Gaiellaceae bacterium]
MSKGRSFIVALLCVLTLVASASAATAGQQTQTQSLQTIRLALFPSLDYAPLFVGLKLGIWKKAGLDVKITYVFTGAGLFAALTSGSADLATNSPSAGANAIAQGLPLKMLTAAAYQATKGNTEVLVRRDSPIRGFGDLADKTVATINLQGLFHLGTAYAIEKAGKDPLSMRALAMAPVDEPNALAAGRLDAIVLQDPFLTTAKLQNGQTFRSLGNPFRELPYKVPVGAFWTTDDAIESKAPLLRKFHAAWKESVTAAQKRPKLTRQVIPKYTGITGAVANLITPPEWTSTPPPQRSLGPMLALARKYGWIKTIPSYSEMVWNGK